MGSNLITQVKVMIVFFSPLKVWGPCSVNGLCFEGHAEILDFKTLQSICLISYFFFLFFLYLLELNDKKNKIG